MNEWTTLLEKTLSTGDVILPADERGDEDTSHGPSLERYLVNLIT